MSNKEQKLEQWAIDIIIDDMVEKGLRYKEDSNYYTSYVALFKKWHKDFDQQEWDKLFLSQLANL